MNKFKTTMRTSREVLAALLLALLPFHALMVTVGGKYYSEFKIITLLLAWKELFAIVLITLCIVEIFLEKGIKQVFLSPQKALKLDWLDATLLTYIALAMVIGIFQQTSLGQWVHGMRISVLPFSLLFFSRRVAWLNGAQLVKITLGVGLITSILGILQALVLPEAWLAGLGYAQNIITDVPGVGPLITGTTSDALQACPPLEHISSFCRAISTFGGPTRFGVYMLVILGLAVSLPMPKKWRAALIVFPLAAALLTYSRSVWIGVLGLFSLVALIKMGKRAIIVGVTALFVVGAVGFFAISLQGTEQHTNPLKSILTRSGSTSKHYEYMVNGLNQVVAEPLGSGLGTAGPASMRYTLFLTENWFLQIFVEMGIAGGVLFIAFIGLLLLKLYRLKTPLSTSLYLGLGAVCLVGLFTHSFEELAASYTLMILSGVAISSSSIQRGGA